MLKVGSLFAGIGGICLAFQKAGYVLSWSNEIDKNACKTYRKNFKHNLIEGDIRSLDPNNLEKVDILTGGFPCQAFSIAGHRKGFEDDRGSLFFEILKFIDAHKPRVVFLENVRYLKTHDNGRTYARIIDELEIKRKYTVKAEILNTYEYSNIPQNRERIYLVCFRDQEDADKFTFPAKTNSLKPLDKILEPTADDLHYFNRYPHYYNIAVKDVDDSASIYQWRRVYLRKNKNGLCPTLTANMGCGGHNVPLIKDSKDIRRLTPRECLRFQGFNESFKLPNDISIGSIYKQIGNSVSVPVVERIANNIKKAITQK